MHLLNSFGIYKRQQKGVIKRASLSDDKTSNSSLSSFVVLKPKIYIDLIVRTISWVYMIKIQFKLPATIEGFINYVLIVRSK